MFTSQLSIQDPLGLHARPAGEIVRLSREFGIAIRLGRPGEALVSANGPLALLALKAKPGDQLTVEIDSVDSEQVTEVMSRLQEILKG